jgi:hypothetical protein
VVATLDGVAHRGGHGGLVGGRGLGVGSSGLGFNEGSETTGSVIGRTVLVVATRSR